MIGAAGGGGATSWNGLYAQGQTLTVSAATMTISGTHATNDVLTISSTTTSGALLDLDQTGAGADITGSGDTWTVSKAGAITGLTVVLAGTADSVGPPSRKGISWCLTVLSRSRTTSTALHST